MPGGSGSPQVFGHAGYDRTFENVTAADPVVIICGRDQVAVEPAVAPFNVSLPFQPEHLQILNLSANDMVIIINPQTYQTPAGPVTFANSFTLPAGGIRQIDFRPIRELRITTAQPAAQIAEVHLW